MNSLITLLICILDVLQMRFFIISKSDNMSISLSHFFSAATHWPCFSWLSVTAIYPFIYHPNDKRSVYLCYDLLFAFQKHILALNNSIIRQVLSISIISDGR